MDSGVKWADPSEPVEKKSRKEKHEQLPDDEKTVQYVQAEYPDRMKEFVNLWMKLEAATKQKLSARKVAEAMDEYGSSEEEEEEEESEGEGSSGSSASEDGSQDEESEEEQ